MTPTSLASLPGIDAAALTERMNERFAAADVDGSGAISQSEFSDALASQGIDSSQAAQAFSRLDSDGDGNLTQQEQLERVQALTDRVRSYGATDGAGTAFDSLSTLLETLGSDSEDPDIAEQAQSLLRQLQEGQGLDDADSFLSANLPSIDVSA